jgi:murein DD-endopeptidase MepM/ murein hydrolase activator NlpD
MRKYIIVGFLICFSTQIIAGGTFFQSKKNQTDSCYNNFKADYKSLYKAIDKVNKNYADNYLYVLSLHNYHFDSVKYAKEWSFFSLVSLKADTAIRNAKEKDTNYCLYIADVYMLRGIALLYQQNYMEAYRIFDTIITKYPNTKNYIDAYLWQAHTAVCMEAYDTANLILQTIETELDTSNTEFYKRYQSISADLFIKTYHYENVLNYLLKIEQMPFSRKFLIRVQFIIAQVYNQLGNYKDAALYYEKVTKYIFGVEKLMKSYSVIYEHFCEKLLLEEEQRQLALKKEKLEHPEPKEFEPTVVESTHDSSFLYMNYPYYFNDDAAMFFLDESSLEDDTMEDYGDDSDYIDDHFQTHFSYEMLESLFENWDSISIHIPKTDFSTMTDTIYLSLITYETEYTLPRISSIISRFGWRRYRYHYGIDTKNTLGDSIFCIFDGVVRIAKRNKTYGNVVIVRHYNGLETFYAHCSKLLVEPNQAVKAGDLIALVGSTGRSSGPHLHFETRYKGVPFNPEYLIDFEKKKLLIFAQKIHLRRPPHRLRVLFITKFAQAIPFLLLQKNTKQA